MIDRLKISFFAALVGLSMSALAPLSAQEFDDSAPYDEGRDESLYYSQPTYRPNTRAIIHQKAQTRALQRQARLASLSWNSMSTGRPTSASTPFTSHGSPLWQTPRPRPFAWYSTAWPAYVYYAR